MSKWDFCTLVENAGYNSHNCYVINDNQFGYRNITGNYKTNVCFNAKEIEQAKNKNLFVKTKLDKKINME